MKNNKRPVYKVIEIKTGRVIGDLIGKSLDRELYIKNGRETFAIKITPETEAMYRVEVRTHVA